MKQYTVTLDSCGKCGEIREMLKKLSSDKYGDCPECHAYTEYGHFSTCALDKMIRGSK